MYVAGSKKKRRISFGGFNRKYTHGIIEVFDLVLTVYVRTICARVRSFKRSSSVLRRERKRAVDRSQSCCLRFSIRVFVLHMAVVMLGGGTFR